MSDENPERKVAIVGVACAIGFVAISGIAIAWQSDAPVATEFSRVGGATRVETALQAATFWAEPPTSIVLLPPKPSVGLNVAIGCAAFHDAPILFWGNEKQRERLKATYGLVEADSDNAPATHTGAPDARRGEGVPEVWMAGFPPARDPKQRDSPGTTPKNMQAPTFTNAVERPCPVSTAPPAPQRSGAGKVVALEGTLDGLLDCGVEVSCERRLPRTVVFASPVSGDDAPDVAVGAALAYHLASKEDVGFVVVPRYLESMPELRQALANAKIAAPDRGWPVWGAAEQVGVESGVVLGLPNRMSAEVQTALRKLLRASSNNLPLWRQLYQDTVDLILKVLALAALTAGVVKAGEYAILRAGRYERDRQAARRSIGPAGQTNQTSAKGESDGKGRSAMRFGRRRAKGRIEILATLVDRSDPRTYHVRVDVLHPQKEAVTLNSEAALRVDRLEAQSGTGGGGLEWKEGAGVPFASKSVSSLGGKGSRVEDFVQVPGTGPVRFTVTFILGEKREQLSVIHFGGEPQLEPVSAERELTNP